MNKGVKIPKDVLFQEVSGEMVLLDMKSENYFGLDAVGARIWSLLSEGTSISRLLGILEEEYDVERDRLEADVEELLNSLIEAGLISQ